MSRKILLATEKPFARAARDEVVGILKQQGYEVAALEGYTTKAELLAAVADVDAMIIRSDVVDAEVLGAAGKLALVVRAGAGYDNIDCAAAKARGVAAMNTPGQNANAVAELAFGLMLYMCRHKFSGKSGSELRGKTLGIHAIGAVGRAVAAIGRGMGMNVRAFDVIPPEAILDAGADPVKTVEELYRTCDFVSLHVPLIPATKKLVGHKLLSLMPKGGCLVNTARKEIIDEEGLLQALGERKDLRYVSDLEPSPETMAVIKEKFADRTVFTAKKSGAQTEEANTNAGIAAARQIIGFFERGDRKFVVNP